MYHIFNQKVFPSNSPHLHSHCDTLVQPSFPDLSLKQLQVLYCWVLSTVGYKTVLPFKCWPALNIAKNTYINAHNLPLCRNLSVPWTLLNITKLVLSLTLALLPISDLLFLVYVYQGGGVVAQVHIVANIVRAASYLLALLLMLNCKRRGEVTSGSLFIYWLVASACAAITFRF